MVVALVPLWLVFRESRLPLKVTISASTGLHRVIPYET